MKMTKIKSKRSVSLFLIILGIVFLFPALKAETGISLPEKTLYSTTKEAPGNISIDFSDVDINDALRILSYKSGVNIVATPAVKGRVRIRLVDVPWEDALDIILQTYNLGKERKGNVITVDNIDVLTEKKKAQLELREVEPLLSEVINLRFLDANDAKKALDPQLSSRGKITIVAVSGQKGWKFAAEEKRLGKRERVEERTEKEVPTRSKVLVITDIPSRVAEIKKVIAKIDVRPKQVLIQTRIMEVSEGTLRDLGLDWATGTTGAEAAAITDVTMTKKKNTQLQQSLVGGHSSGSLVSPAGFNPLATAISGTFPYNLGLSLVFKKLTPPEMEIIIHALEEDSRTNTLSAPRIVTLDNQEATILVGTKFPILESEVTGTTTTTVTASLDYYQDIGIQLNVVPQVNEDNMVNMIVHPSVTDYTTTLDTHTESGEIMASYPIIQTREAETQILMNDGETIVLGGLLKDVHVKTRQGIPYLMDIPILGRLFTRDTTDVEKIDLLVFLTAHVIDYEKEAAEILADSSVLLPQGDFPDKKSKKKSKKKSREK
jgi:type IV pilus assembly protein PilQ